MLLTIIIILWLTAGITIAMSRESEEWYVWAVLIILAPLVLWINAVNKIVQ